MLPFTVLIAFFSSVVSSVPHHSIPDMKPVELVSWCAHAYTYDKTKASVIMIHGLSDSHKTWNGIYEVITLKTKRQVCTLDLRNHGLSPWTDVFNFDVLAVDVNHFMERKNISKAVFVGHSLGGTTAMKFALAWPEKAEKLIIEDIAPGQVTPENVQPITFGMQVLKESLEAIPPGSDLKSAKLAVIAYIKSKFPSENEADMFTDKEVENLPLHFENGVFKWLTNLDAILKALESPETLMLPYSGEYNGDALFIYGTKSPFKVYDSKELIMKLFPKAEFLAIEGASHMIHTRYPEFLTAVLKYIKGD